MPWLSISKLSALGLTATIAIAIGSYGAGALPANDPTRRLPVLGLLRHGAGGLHTALALYYLGLVAFIVSWLLLGRILLARTDPLDPAPLRAMFIRWMLPLLAAMPLASTDLYSYAAQAQLSRRGFDPYTATPADLPGKFLDNVAWKWVDTPSPYGPMWVAISRWAAALTGNHALISVLLLRLLPFGSLIVIAWLLPVLSNRFGVRADIAVWLVVANPVMIIHGVGGGHNDVVMVMFLLAAVCVVSRPGAGMGDLAAAAVLSTLAGAVKAPGLVAVAFIVPIYLMPRAGIKAREWVRCCGLVAVTAVLVFGLASLVAGVGLGWTRQISTSIPVINFMSIPTMAAVAYRFSIGAPHAGTVIDQTVRNFRAAGSIISALLLVTFWLRATRGSALQLLTLSLVTIVVLSPAVQPWYFLWALACVALLTNTPRRLYWLATASIALTLLTRPMGSSLDGGRYLPAVIAAAWACRTLLGPAVRKRAPQELAAEKL
jgi:alpha-1,6-mannosyltransferase